MYQRVSPRFPCSPFVRQRMDFPLFTPQLKILCLIHPHTWRNLSRSRCRTVRPCRRRRSLGATIGIANARLLAAGCAVVCVFAGVYWPHGPTGRRAVAGSSARDQYSRVRRAVGHARGSASGEGTRRGLAPDQRPVARAAGSVTGRRYRCRSCQRRRPRRAFSRVISTCSASGSLFPPARHDRHSAGSGTPSRTWLVSPPASAASSDPRPAGCRRGIGRGRSICGRNSSSFAPTLPPSLPGDG